MEMVDDIKYETEWTESQLQEAEERYIKEFYPKISRYNEERHIPQSADTLDEYLMLLREGFINVKLRDGLEKYLMELLEDDWFHQWPLVHWAYASRLLYKSKSARAIKRAVELLYPMAEARCPGALYDIGYCYMNEKGLKRSYPRAIYCWVLASELGFLEAQDMLKQEYYHGSDSDHKSLPEELRYAFFCQVIDLILKDNNADADNIFDKLDSKESDRIRKLYKKAGKLEKIVSQKKLLRDTSRLFWEDEENPYRLVL